MKNLAFKIGVPLLFVALVTLSIVCNQSPSEATSGDTHEHSHTHDGDDHSHSHSHNGDDHSHSHSSGDGHTHATPDGRPAYTYLAMNGEFQMNPNDSMTQNDPRNPSRLVLKTSDEAGTLTRMAFYDHDDMEKKLAECGYEFIGSRPDPHYYPGKSKTSIWDIFKKVEDYDGNCANYKYVLSRSPHGDPVHMHLRYGDDVDKLLAMSNAPEDSNFNPWWSIYCDIERTTSCD